MALLPGFVPPLFETEENATRFERVALELYERAEGVTLVPTSRNYDLGRDARQISIGGAPLPGVLCASLSVELDEKVRKDIDRLLATTETAAIVFASARNLTEQACDRIEAEIRRLYPKAESVRVLAQVQLSKLGQDHEDVLRKYYPGEIANLEQVLLSSGASSPTDNVGLRLALITQTGDDARELRSELARRLILEQLSEMQLLSPNDLSARIAQQLHLPHSPSADFIRQLLRDLEAGGHVSFVADRASITPAGTEFIASVPTEASERLLEGRSVVRDAIGRLSGHVLHDTMFETVWRSFQDGMSDAFYNHGAAIIEMVSAIASGVHASSVATQHPNFLERLAERVSTHFTNPDQRDEIKQAVLDMFLQKDSEAFEWLSSICSVYVMMCSLGLETRSAREIANTLRGLRLVPDTDILISLLCEGERNHEEADRVLRGWRSLGGSLFVATPILEEVAHHAWIAEHDYQATKYLFARLDAVDLERVVSNAFVRSFHFLSRGRAHDGKWHEFIREYRGRNETDYTKVLEILVTEHGVQRLPDFVARLETADENTFDSRVSRFIRQRLADEYDCDTDELDYRTLDKSRRDALLLVNLRSARESYRSAGTGGSALILSSAHLLREAGSTFADELGEPDPVVSLAAVAALLALTPGVNLGLRSLRGILFDHGLAKRLGRVHLFAYRVVVASDSYDLPYSRRVTLQRRLRERILTDARRSGRSVQAVERSLMAPERTGETAQAIKGVLDRMAVEPRTRELLEERDRQIARLQAEIRTLRSSNDDAEPNGAVRE